MVEEAIAFLEAFEYQLLTFSLFKGGKPVSTQAISKENFAKNRETFFKAVNDKGYEVFFMVNEGDGIIHSGKSTPRSQDSVVTLKSLFIDTDSCPLEKVLKYLASIKLKPHYIINTSPDKYHLYFLLEDTAPTAENLDMWQACQTALAYLGNTNCEETGCDLAMKDYSRILRVPGCYHQKKEPFLVTIYKKQAIPKYTLHALYNTLQAQHFKVHVTSAGYTPPVEKVSKGARHEALISFVAMILQKDIKPEIAESLIYDHIRANFEAPEDFLPGGADYQEVIRAIGWKRASMHRENVAELKSSLITQYVKNTENTFTQPDEYYFQAPGILGKMTREIAQSAEYRSVPSIFAQCLSSIATLKSPYTVGALSNGAKVYPVNYFICLARSGAGKGTPQRILSNTFSEIGKQQMIDYRMRSAIGLYTFLKSNNSCGLIMSDEAKNIFQQIYDSKSASYLADIRPTLLQLYSQGGHANVHPGTVGKKDDLTLSFPRLNLICFGTPELLKESFSLSSIHDGFLQRFIIFSDNSPRVYTRAEKYLDHLEGESFDYFMELVTMERQSVEKAFLQIEALKEEYEHATKKKQEAIQKEIAELENYRNPHYKVVRFSEDAEKILYALRDDLDRRYNDAMKVHSQLSDLYVRGYEQALRLCVSGTDSDTVSATEAKFYADLVLDQIRSLYAHCAENIGVSKVYDFAMQVKDFVIAEFITTGEPVPMRIAYKRFHVDKATMQRAVDTLVAAAEIQTVQARDKRGKFRDALLPVGEEYLFIKNQ